MQESHFILLASISVLVAILMERKLMRSLFAHFLQSLRYSWNSLYFKADIGNTKPLERKQFLRDSIFLSMKAFLVFAIVLSVYIIVNYAGWI